jgi:Mg2+/Co2+ transporter CorC
MKQNQSISLLKALLSAAHRNSSCIDVDVQREIERVYNIAHGKAQDSIPEKYTIAVKSNEEKDGVESAIVNLDSDIPCICETQAKTFGITEIRVNPNDLTVFQVSFVNP